MEENEPPSLFQHALRWGLIVGAISIALTCVIYAIDYAWLANWKTGIVVFALTIGLVIYAGINYRGEIGGFIAYGKAWQHGFVLMAIAGFLATGFSLLLYTVIDPELPAKLTDVTIENTEAMMKNFGMPEDQLDKALDDARVRTEKQFSPLGVLMTYGIGLIIYCVLALITSIFVKKNQPEEII